MTYYIAKSTRDDDPSSKYICVSENMQYGWYSAISNIRPTDLPADGHLDSVHDISLWLENLADYNMEFVLSFTELSHPEFFI